MLAEVERAIAERPAGRRLVFLSDYDGTLAEFHPDPEVPRPSEQIAALLYQVSQRSDMSFGIVSGRRVSDLRTRTQLPAHVYFAGLHGLEIEIGTHRWQHPDLDHARQYVRVLYERLGPLRDRIPGLRLEDKDASLAVHVRGVEPALRALGLAEADRHAEELVFGGKLRRLSGNLVLEYLPNIAMHKGDAVHWIAAHVRARHDQPVWVVFVGDDVTDEDAFGAIGDEGIGVLVGSRETRASYALADTTEVCRLLQWLATEDGARAATARDRLSAPP